MNTALRHQSEWKHVGTNLDVAVNLSTITLGNAELPGVIGQALGTWQADPSHLTLEITENATINDMDYSLVIMNQLKKMGVKLSVDDFVPVRPANAAHGTHDIGNGVGLGLLVHHEVEQNARLGVVVVVAFAIAVVNLRRE